MRTAAAIVAAVAVMAAAPAQAQERELINLGFGLLGHVIQQSQKPQTVQQPQRPQAPRPAVVAAPSPKVAPVPAPLPSFRIAEASIETPATVSDATAPIYLDHNSSRMAVTIEGDIVRIVYDAPRPGLAQAGVTPGTTLFVGGVINGQLYGEAFAFKSNCEPAGYAVQGKFDAYGIVLDGPGPVRSGCAVARLDPASPHSHLEFDGDATGLAALIIEEPPTVPVIATVPQIEPQPLPAIVPAAPVAPAPVPETPVIAAPVISNPAPPAAPAIETPKVETAETPTPPSSSPTAPKQATPAAQPQPEPVAPKPSLDMDL